jgi:hypothetical protein
MVLGWSAFAVALFYWLRCCVIGLVALVTMADRPVDPREGEDDRIVATVLFGIVFSMALAFGLLGVVFVFAGRWHQVAPNHWHAESAPLSDAALLKRLTNHRKEMAEKVERAAREVRQE